MAKKEKQKGNKNMFGKTDCKTVTALTEGTVIISTLPVESTSVEAVTTCFLKVIFQRLLFF